MKNFGLTMAPNVMEMADGSIQYEFPVKVAERIPKYPHVRSPSIRENIENGKLEWGRTIGFIKFLVNVGKRQIEVTDYRPFSYVGVLRRKGLASAVELACLNYLQKKYKGFTLLHVRETLPPRDRQLTQRGSKKSQPIEEEMDKIRKRLLSRRPLK